MIGAPAVQFLNELDANNDKVWWTANKARYERDVLGPMQSLADALAPDFGVMTQMASSFDTTFNADLGVEDADGNQWPGMSVFTRSATGEVHHRYTSLAFLGDGDGRGIDQLTPTWNVFDLTPSGRPDWWPGNDYPPVG